MSDNKVSIRYATSLLGSSTEKKSLDTAAKDMEFTESVIASSSKLKLMLLNPVIKSEIKINILKEIFRDRISEDSLDFLIFVVNKNREELLLSILRKFLQLKDEYLGIVSIKVKTAQELTKVQMDTLRTKFELLLNKKIKFSYEIDENIIGGFIAVSGDTVYDASLLHQLALLKKQFVEGVPGGTL